MPNSQKTQRQTVTKEQTMSLLRDPSNPITQCMALISDTTGRIEQDAQQRRPEGPVVWKTWTAETVLKIAEILNVDATPLLPE